jgi:DNA-binding GntR family transcriptional regulator
MTAKASKRAGNMASLIYERIRADILEGRLAAGTPLAQLTLARAAGTSRGPVREALRRLQQDRLVIARANKRFNVAPCDLADLESVLCLHLVNVRVALEVCVPLLGDDEIGHLESGAERMVAAVEGADRLGLEAAYGDFVLTVVGRAGPRIASLIGELIDNIRRYRETALDRTGSIHVAVSEIEETARAVMARDGKLAAFLYARCIGRVSTRMIEGAGQDYEPTRLRAYIEALGAADAH